MTGQMKKCINLCLQCHGQCLQAARRSLAKGGRFAEVSHVRILLICAEFCQTTANLLLWGTLNYRRVASLCAELCEECAQACISLHDDKDMATCAETAALCAHACSQLVGSTEEAAGMNDLISLQKRPLQPRDLHA